MNSSIRFGEPIDLTLLRHDLPERVISNKSNIAKEREFQVYFVARVLEQIWAHARQQPRVECSGILVGQPCQTLDLKVTFVVIVGAVPHQTNRRSVGHVTVGPAEIAAVREIIETNFPNCIPVGWYHSHPGHGIFLSGQDMTIVRSIYNQAWHIAVVVDPIRNEAGMFYGESGTPLEGWLEVADATWLAEDAQMGVEKTKPEAVAYAVSQPTPPPEPVVEARDPMQPTSADSPSTTLKTTLAQAEKHINEKNYESAFLILKHLAENQSDPISDEEALQKFSRLNYEMVSGLAQQNWQKAQSHFDFLKKTMANLLYIVECEEVIKGKKKSN